MMSAESARERIRRVLRRAGYSIFKSSSLPVGLDLIADISRIREFSSLTVIFDVGANVGDWTAQYLTHAPNAKFYCFEPAAETARDLSRRMGQTPRVQVIQLAIGSANGSATLYHAAHSVQNSLVAPEGDAGQSVSEQVQVVTLDEFTDARGIAHIDLLKTDTEGFDHQVLMGADGLLGSRRIDFVLVEVNFAERDPSHSSFETISRALRAHGYTPIGFYDVHWWGPPWFVTYMNVLYTCV
jgi:FkbM family methyltransferase